MTDFKLPELGENITAGDVVRVLVKPGDTIAKDQAVLELETDKATIEVPSSVAGVVKDVQVKAGQKIKVGATILTVEGNGGDAAKPAADAKAAEPKAAEPKAAESKGDARPDEAKAKEPEAKAADSDAKDESLEEDVQE